MSERKELQVYICMCGHRKNKHKIGGGWCQFAGCLCVCYRFDRVLILFAD